MSGYTSGSIPSVLFIDNEAIRNFEHNGIKCGDGKYSDIECFPLKSHGDDTTESGYQVPPSIIDTFSGTPYQDYPNTIKQRYYPGDGLTYEANLFQGVLKTFPLNKKYTYRYKAYS